LISTSPIHPPLGDLQLVSKLSALDLDLTGGLLMMAMLIWGLMMRLYS